jgi:hypothetical protein
VGIFEKTASGFAALIMVSATYGRKCRVGTGFIVPTKLARVEHRRVPAESKVSSGPKDDQRQLCLCRLFCVDMETWNPVVTDNEGAITAHELSLATKDKKNKMKITLCHCRG